MKSKPSMGFLSNLGQSLFRRIVKHCVLPATLFRKTQILTVHENFEHFWSTKAPKPATTPTCFSTITLGNPLNLWSYYFQEKDEIAMLKKAYTPIAFNTPTEDGSLLCGTLFKSSRRSSHTRTLIVFGGNGDLYKIGTSAWLLKLLQQAPIPFNIVMFDPRECGHSQGEAHAKGLVADGETIYRYVQRELHVHEDYIDLCGFSLGAAVATLVKAKHPHTQGVLISNRSFQSLDHAVKGFFSPLTQSIAEFFGTLASKMAYHCGWILNPFEAWQTITSPKMVICHKDDPVVRHCASLEQALCTGHLLNDCHHIHLVQKNPNLPIQNHHVQPLSFYNDHLGQDAEQQILDFLLPSRNCLTQVS